MKKKNNQEEINISLKLIAKSSFFVLLGILFSKILTYFYRILIARYYGPEVYGIFAVSVMILLWFNSFASLGLVEGVLRFVSFYRGKNEIKKVRYIFRLSAITLLVSTILSSIILFSVSEFISLNIFHDANLVPFLKFFSILIPLYVFLYLFLAVVRAYEKIKVHTFILDFLMNFLKLVFLIIFIFLGLQTKGIIFSYFLGVFFSFLAAFIYIKYKFSFVFNSDNLEKESQIKLRKKLYSYSWPLILSSVLIGILPYIDSFVIGYFKGSYDIGIYNAAVPIAGLLLLAPNIFLALFLPLITKEFSKQNNVVIKELSKQTEKWILILNMPLFLLMMLFPGTFINLLFGSQYLIPAAEISLRFLSIGGFFFSMSLVMNNLMQMAGKSKTILSNILIVIIFNFVLNMFLVPKYGISGAAFSTMLGNLLISLFFLVQVRSILSTIPFRRKMLGVVFSALVPSIILLFIKNMFPINLVTLFIQGVFFMLMYIFLILLTKSLDKNDLLILNMIRKKHL
jgi:O-antigen/teichoic acid export membrane protein